MQVYFQFSCIYTPKNGIAGSYSKPIFINLRIYQTVFHKKNKVLILATIWMNLKTLCLMKEAQHKRVHTARIYSYEMSRRGKYIKTESRLVFD